MNRILCWLWSAIYRSHLRAGERVTYVLGWRTARIIDDARGVKVVQPCFLCFD